ncbi:cytochrome b5, partial [Lophium mytilinum]
MPKDYTYAEVSDHNSPGDALLVIEGKVYDISTFAEDHPGGEPIILDQAGSDATEAFRDVGHSDDARAILRTLLVGIL